jgi:hypothetical protein
MNFIVLRKEMATEPLNDIISFIAVKKHFLFSICSKKEDALPSDIICFLLFKNVILQGNRNSRGKNHLLIM